MALNRLAFLDIVTLEDGKTLRGGILVTHTNTAPIEFFLTDGIVPTSAQKTLYGAIFDRHLKVEIFGKPLLKILKEKPDVIITKDTGLFQFLPKATELPVILVSSPANIQEISLNEALSKNGFRNEINGISHQENLFEPFDRIKKAILQVHKQEVNHKSANQTQKIDE